MKVIIAGAGMAGSQLHLNAYRQVSGIEVIALCDPDLDKAKGIARQKGVRYAFSSLDEALSELSADIVSICTPPSSHYELCRLALERGSNVLVEKPAFQTLEEADQIQELVTRTGRKFSAVHNVKYQPGIRQAIKLASEGAIGDILQVHVARMIDGNTDRLAADPGSWCHRLPGGRWEELIAHPLYKAYQFMGPMRFVSLKMKNVYDHQPWLPGDELEIMLESATGYVSIKLSANAADYSFMVVYGSKKCLLVDSDVAIDALSMANHPGHKPSLRKSLRDLLHAALNPQTIAYPQDTHTALIKEFIAYVKGDRTAPPVDWQEMRNTLELGLLIGREIRQGKAHLQPSFCK
jgi:predicted dehydrogenase